MARAVMRTIPGMSMHWSAIAVVIQSISTVTGRGRMSGFFVCVRRGEGGIDSRFPDHEVAELDLPDSRPPIGVIEHAVLRTGPCMVPGKEHDIKRVVDPLHHAVGLRTSTD